MSEQNKDKEFPVCEDCGVSDSSVAMTTCPYVEHFWDEIEYTILCDKCYDDRAKYV